jgi:uncharacterized membrane protein YcaP (DUF421 family)
MRVDARDVQFAWLETNGQLPFALVGDLHPASGSNAMRLLVWSEKPVRDPPAVSFLTTGEHTSALAPV